MTSLSGSPASFVDSDVLNDRVAVPSANDSDANRSCRGKLHKRPANAYAGETCDDTNDIDDDAWTPTT